MADLMADVLLTADRRRIWTALRRGHEVFIRPDGEAVDAETGERYGCQIAAQVIVFAGFARFLRAPREWVIAWRPRGFVGDARRMQAVAAIGEQK